MSANNNKKRKRIVAKKKEKRRISILNKLNKEKKKKGLHNKYSNGRLIYECMVDAGYKGDVRDYVILTGSSIIDYRGSYNMVVSNAGVANVDETYIIHKSRLKNVIGEKAAKQFWHPIFGRLIDVKEGDRPKNG